MKSSSSSVLGSSRASRSLVPEVTSDWPLGIGLSALASRHWPLAKAVRSDPSEPISREANRKGLILRQEAIFSDPPGTPLFSANASKGLARTKVRRRKSDVAAGTPKRVSLHSQRSRAFLAKEEATQTDTSGPRGQRRSAHAPESPTALRFPSEPRSANADLGFVSRSLDGLYSQSARAPRTASLPMWEPEAAWRSIAYQPTRRSKPSRPSRRDGLPRTGSGLVFRSACLDCSSR